MKLFRCDIAWHTLTAILSAMGLAGPFLVGDLAVKRNIIKLCTACHRT
jgi:hypothetical protein